MNTAANAPAWIEAERGRMRPMHVTVSRDCGQRDEFEALFWSTFDAYDEALRKFPDALRIEVKAKPAKAAGGSHAA